MKVFSESEGTAKSMEKMDVSVCIRDMTASWLGHHPQDKGSFADNVQEQVRLHEKKTQKGQIDMFYQFFLIFF